MKIAIIGQSLFGAETYSLLRSNGHKVVGVFTIPDVDGKPDPLGKLMLLILVGMHNLHGRLCAFT